MTFTLLLIMRLGIFFFKKFVIHSQTSLVRKRFSKGGGELGCFKERKKFKFKKQQIIFPLDYINEHSMTNFCLLGRRKAFRQTSINFTKKASFKYKGKNDKSEF